MEPGVPFALLGAAALLLVAAQSALAAAGFARHGLRPPALLLGAGALLLSGVEVVTATKFGTSASDPLAQMRAAGFLLVTAGLALGGLGPARPLAEVPPYAVVVPLAATPSAAGLAGVAGLAAALAALRTRRDAVGRLVAAGLALAALAAAAAPLADDTPGRAAAVVGLRLAAALVMLAGLGTLGRRSLLVKVIAAILVGVLVMSAAALAVVGTVVADANQEQAARLVTDAADSRQALLRTEAEPLRLTAPLLARACTTPDRCAEVLARLSPDRADFVVRVRRGAGPVLLASRSGTLTGTDLLGLSRLPAVRTVLTGEGGQVVDPVPALARLAGPSAELALVVVAPGVRDRPEDDPRDVLVHGLRVTDEFLSVDLRGSAFGVAVLTGDPLRVSASSDPGGDEPLLARVRDSLARQPIGDRRTLSAVGNRPTTHLRVLRGETGQRLGLLAVSLNPRASLQGQRQALSRLLQAALVTTAAVTLLALALGRRTVEPVRRLTAAARRVAAGDLTGGGPAVSSADEVGVLARTFDTMTRSLASLTGDLRSTAARLETVLASMTDGVVAAGPDGCVIAVNRAALRLLGRGREEIVGRPLGEVADVRDAAGEPLADPALRVQDVPADVHRADGSVVPVRASLTALLSTSGEELDEGVVLVLHDTTREREVERMKTEFLSNVSHELRTPLTPIRGYADLLANRPGLAPEKVAAFAGTILAESLKMNRVVDLLVDIASIEAGRVHVAPREVVVRDLLDDRLSAWRARAPERASDLRRRVATGLPPVHVDPEWVGKALDELIDNAVKYTPPGTSITLLAGPSPDGERVRVAVRDAGPGIPEASQGGLFTSFQQVDGSATRRVGGLGLGLSFVRRLAEDAGLPLYVRTAAGRGAEFGLDLPAHGPMPAARPPQPRRSSAGDLPQPGAPAGSAVRDPASRAPGNDAPASGAPGTGG